MGNEERFQAVRARLDELWSKVRRLKESDKTTPGSMRRCSYCREPGHYRPTCERHKEDLAELHAAFEALEQDLVRAREEAAQAIADRQWWINKAFELQDEIDKLRKDANVVIVHSESTR